MIAFEHVYRQSHRTLLEQALGWLQYQTVYVEF
jgi:hypothetical protein